MNPSFKNNNYNKDSNLLINSYDKKFGSTFIPTSTKLNINDEEYPIYSNHKTNKTIENKSLDLNVLDEKLDVIETYIDGKLF